MTSCRYFLLSDGINIGVYSYEGRLVSTPKIMSSKPDSINVHTVAICSDTIAIRDATDTKCKSDNHRNETFVDELRTFELLRSMKNNSFKIISKSLYTKTLIDNNQ